MNYVAAERERESLKGEFPFQQNYCRHFSFFPTIRENIIEQRIDVSVSGVFATG